MPEGLSSLQYRLLFWGLRAAPRVARKVIPRIAEWAGVALLEVRGKPNKPMQMDGRNDGVFDWSWAEVVNFGRLDLVDCQCRSIWRRSGSTQTYEYPLAWSKKKATGILGFSGDPVESLTLPSNQDPQHLLIAAKYPNQKAAYITNRANALGSKKPAWVHPQYAVDPGHYEVELVMTAAGGVSGRVFLTFENDGQNGTVRVELVPRHTVKR